MCWLLYVQTFHYKSSTNKLLEFEIHLLHTSVFIKPTFLIGKWRKIKFFKILCNNKNSISLSHKDLVLFNFLPQNIVELWRYVPRWGVYWSKTQLKIEIDYIRKKKKSLNFELHFIQLFKGLLISKSRLVSRRFS